MRTSRRNHLWVGLLRPAVLLAGIWLAPHAFAQCTLSDWSSSTGTVQAIGHSTTPIGRAYQQDCGLTVGAAASPAYVTTDSPSSETMVHARFYLHPGDLNLSSGKAKVLRGRNGNTEVVNISLRRNGDEFELFPAYRSGGSMVQAATAVPVKNGWQAVTLSWSANGVGGSVGISVDGLQQLFINDIDNGNERINQIDLGLLNDVAGSGKVAFDSAEFRRGGTVPALAPVNELFNIATRARVGSDAYAVIGGFIIKGEDEKCVIIRGRGQSVNVNGTLVGNPNLALYAGASYLEGNDNWKSHARADLIRTSGREPQSDTDAAIYRCLSPGNYTVHLRPQNNQGRGIGIVEVLDIDSSQSYLYNIATRAEVRNGDEVVIAGFVINGQEPKQILIRGRGPSVNITQPRLGDPSIQLMRGATQVATNNNWQSAANASEISATGKAPGHSKDAAILATLQPGAYTVILRSANSGTGIGIIEVLDLTGGSVAAD